MGKDEPHCSLCVSPVWFVTDLPGLERCLIECARDEKRAKEAAARIDVLVAGVLAALDALDRGRGGVEERTQLEQALRLARAQTLAEVRIAALFEIGKGNGAQAEAIARKGLPASRTDVGLLDVLAQALALQGKAEESRHFPLTDLNRNAGLVLYQDPGFVLASTQRYDRAFEAARVLFKANAQAGKAQFEAIRTAFGAGQESTIVEPGNLALWLLLKDEPELARQYLEEASHLHKTDDALSVSAAWEMPLLSMQIEELKGPPKNPPPEGEAALPNPWLEIAQRAGLLRGHALDVNPFLLGMGNPGIYMSYRNSILPYAARASKRGTEFLPTLLAELPALLGERCTPDELDALLLESSAQTKQLRVTLDQFAALIDECLANRQNWEAREKAGQRAVPIICAFESRALAIQARFAQKPAKNLSELNAWLAKYQPILDPRRTFKSVPLTETDVRLGELRSKRVIPEIFHGGLLLDCALALARNGAFEDAGELLLLNPHPWLDGISAGRRMQMAALFFRKAGKPDQELKARTALAWQEMEQISSLATIEFAKARTEILEFGTPADVVDYISMRYVPGLRGEAIDAFIALAPELKEVDNAIWFRHTPQEGASLLYGGTFEGNSLINIYENWPKILMTGQANGTIWRMALWCLVSDFSLGRRWDDFGLASTPDCLTCWRMLASAQSLAGSAAKTAAEKLDKMALRCGGNTQESEDVEVEPDEG